MILMRSEKAVGRATTLHHCPSPSLVFSTRFIGLVLLSSPVHWQAVWVSASDKLCDFAPDSVCYLCANTGNVAMRRISATTKSASSLSTNLRPFTVQQMPSTIQQSCGTFCLKRHILPNQEISRSRVAS